jgi:hypothetical protein
MMGTGFWAAGYHANANHPYAVVIGAVLALIGIALTAWPVTHHLWRKVVAIVCYCVAVLLVVWGLVPHHWLPWAIAGLIAVTCVIGTVWTMARVKKKNKASECDGGGAPNGGQGSGPEQTKQECMALVRQLREFVSTIDAHDPAFDLGATKDELIREWPQHHRRTRQRYADKYAAQVLVMFDRLADEGLIDARRRNSFQIPASTLDIEVMSNNLEAAVSGLPG